MRVKMRVAILGQGENSYYGVFPAFLTEEATRLPYESSTGSLSNAWKRIQDHPDVIREEFVLIAYEASGDITADLNKLREEKVDCMICFTNPLNQYGERISQLAANEWGVVPIIFDSYNSLNEEEAFIPETIPIPSKCFRLSPYCDMKKELKKILEILILES
jgi:hypothetical protein